MFIGMNLSIIGQLLGSAAAIDASYRIGSFSPKLVLDFTNEYYRTGGALTTFDSALTATRAGNATMVDSDGKIKWAPHNLLTYSEDFSNAAWTKNSLTISANSSVAPDGTTTADTLTGTGSGVTFLRSGHSYPTGSAVRLSVYVKAGTASTVTFGDVNLGSLGGFNLLTGAVISGATAQISSVGNDWYLCSVSFTPINPSSFFLNPGSTVSPVTTESIVIWGAHLYRSDLGGMVDVPADARAMPSATTYVPTTSAARYLPRRGHHVYNGSEWVNEGLLVESEARTNLVTYSEASTANWFPSGATLTQLSGSYLGAFAGVRAASNGATWHRAKTASVSWTSGQTYNLTTLYVAGTSGRFRIVLRDNAAATESVVYAPIGSAVTVGVTAGAVTNVATEVLDGGVFRTTLTFVPNSTTAIGEIGIGPDSATVGQDIIVLGAQLEAGSTPSSYIPTAGATVTRAAETLVIPSANLPWPTPQYVTGTELVTNGTFDTGTSGWSAAGGGSLSVVGGALRVTEALVDGATGRAFQVIPTVVGKLYLLSVDLIATSHAFDVAVNTSSNFGGAIVADRGSNTPRTVRLPFVATATSTYIIFGVGVDTLGSYSDYDNISVKEINPLSVSIAMDGRMTYADDGSSVTVNLVNWVKDTSNRIVDYVGTFGTKTGAVDFFQTASGVSDVASELTPGSYSPGINVPFNIASRHGSTFINGAVDGVALTADLTPVALPNLSATNLQLGYTFMGTIGSFRIWADDIGDAGLVTATNPSTEPSLLLTFDSAETSFVDLGWSE